MELPIDYELKTTFWQDFTIADYFGIDAIKDTYKRAFGEWKTDVEYLTELCMILNWKAWNFEMSNPEYCDLYVKLYYKTQDYALDHLKGPDLKYFLKITD